MGLRAKAVRRARAAVVVGIVGCAPARPQPSLASSPTSSAALPVAPAVPSAPPASSVMRSVTRDGAAPTLNPPPAATVPPAPVSVSAVATTKTDASWAGCLRSGPPASGDLSSAVAAAARACEAVTRMKLLGATLTGKQADQDPPQAFALEARAHHCYRVYARAGGGIQALHLVVNDSAGVTVGQGSTDDASPVVLQDGAVCFTKDDRASVVVSVGLGRGEYALQIWQDP